MKTINVPATARAYQDAQALVAHQIEMRYGETLAHPLSFKTRQRMRADIAKALLNLRVEPVYREEANG